MAYRRGFKTEANSLGREIRAELELGPFDRMNPFELAANLEVPLLTLTELSEVSPAISHLITNEPEVFSAVTVFYGPSRTIVHNDGHSEPRQNSNLAHELAHALLHHPPSAALDDKGCRNWNQDIEDEANWLAGILLVSEEMTIAIARKKFTQIDAAWKLGVSTQMITFRMNATGAKKRVQRASGTWRD
jgi:hypothetical protein